MSFGDPGRDILAVSLLSPLAAAYPVIARFLLLPYQSTLTSPSLLRIRCNNVELEPSLETAA